MGAAPKADEAAAAAAPDLAAPMASIRLKASSAGGEPWASTMAAATMASTSTTPDWRATPTDWPDWLDWWDWWAPEPAAAG